MDDIENDTCGLADSEKVQGAGSNDNNLDLRWGAGASAQVGKVPNWFVWFPPSSLF